MMECVYKVAKPIESLNLSEYIKMRYITYHECFLLINEASLMRSQKIERHKLLSHVTQKNTHMNQGCYC